MPISFYEAAKLSNEELQAFLASEARSVLVESWVLEDAATEQLMKHFFKHPLEGFRFINLV